MNKILPLCALVLCGCTVGPDFHAPPPPDTQTYVKTPVAAQGFPAADHALPLWWTQFGSDTLNRLVDRALSDSPTLDQARAKLVQASEDYRAQAGATYFPAVDASLSGTRQKVDPAAFGVPIPSPGPFTLYDASVSVSYTLDVFGGERSKHCARKLITSRSSSMRRGFRSRAMSFPLLSGALRCSSRSRSPSVSSMRKPDNCRSWKAA
jgi:outer membrane protein TolC